MPNNFDVWSALTTSYPRVDVAAVPSGGEPAGRRNVNISVNLNVTFDTEKVLLYKFNSMFEFAVSEVKFLNCTQTGMEHAYLSFLLMYTTAIQLKKLPFLLLSWIAALF